MARYQLRTIPSVSVMGPSGTLAVTDDLALALLVMLAIEGEPGVAVDELLLRLTPDATPAEGRKRLEEAARSIGAVLDGRVIRGAERWQLEPGVIEPDVMTQSEFPLTARERSQFLLDFARSRPPEFAEWVASLGPRLGRRRPTRRGPRRWVAAVALLVVAAGLGWLFRPQPTVPFAAGDPLLLADLDNAAGDTLFDRSLATAAEIGLRQSGHVQLVARSRIAATLRRMQLRDSAVRLTMALAREVAAREGIRYVLGLRAERLDHGYRVSATLLDAMTDETVGTFAEPAETRAGTLAALDRALDRVRTRLGESADQRRLRSTPLPLVTTPSLEALRSYALGNEAWFISDYRLARDLWYRAVAFDTGFATALGALGGWYYWHNSPDSGEVYYRAALARSGRLTERERLSLEESAAGYRGDRASAERISRTIAERFPSAVTWYNYGTNLLQASRPLEAIEPLRQALQFEPNHLNALLNLATAFKALDRYRTNIAAEYGYTLALNGQHAEAVRHFESLLERPGLFERTLGHRGLGFMALTAGRFDAAVGSFRQATEISRQQGYGLSIARGELLEGLALLLAGDSADARRTLMGVASRASRGSMAPQFLAMVGHALVVAGQLDEADRVLGQLRRAADTIRLADRDAVAFLSADLLLAQGQAAKALSSLGSVGSTLQRWMVRTRTAEALAAAGRPDSAIALLGAPATASWLGAEATFDWYRSRFVLADLLEARGDRPGARTVLERLGTQWAEGDVGTLAIIDLKARLSR